MKKVSTKKNLITYNLLNFLINIIPICLEKEIKFKLIDNTIVILTNNLNLILLLNFLKNNYFLQFKTLIALTAIDYPSQKNRFEINYFLLSYKLNNRIIIKIKTNDITPINSITSIYNSAN
jgi:NADH:ubiquinone oxidoreductase subunit C